MEDNCLEMLAPSFKPAKPVVITEFRHATTHGGTGDGGLPLSSAGLEESVINLNSQFLHYRIPFLGRLVRPHLNGEHVRDEGWQAKKIVETLGILDAAGVDGVFISQFLSQITPYSENPRYDVDKASSSLVKDHEDGRGGLPTRT